MNGFVVLLFFAGLFKALSVELKDKVDEEMRRRKQQAASAAASQSGSVTPPYGSDTES